MPLKNIRREFIENVANKYIASDASFSHSVRRGSLLDSDKQWIKKSTNNKATAEIEIMAQEFFRLIIPHQSETRLLHDPTDDTYYILSEEVPGYKPLPSNKASNFRNGTYTGLGQVLVAALYLQEIDLKNGNVGLDNQNRVAKIDGDWCFAEGRYQGGGLHYSITPETIASLPYPKDFYAFNWLDIIQQEVAYPVSHIIDNTLTDSPQFRAEVNQAMLKICLLPDSLIERYVAKFKSGDDTAAFIEKMKARRNVLQASALQNPSFQAYLTTEQASLDAESLAAQMNSFVVNGETEVVAPDERISMKAEVLQRLEAIAPRAPVQAEQANQDVESIAADTNSHVVNEETSVVAPDDRTGIETELDAATVTPHINIQRMTNNELLNTIQSCVVNNGDMLILDYVQEKRTQLQSMKTEDQLAIQTQLIAIARSVGSPQVKAAKEAAESLRKSSHWWTSGKKSKAQRIEQALLNTPLEKREFVITEEGSANPVQEALASQLHWGQDGNVYKNELENIDVDKTADTIKNLYGQFFNTKKDDIENKENKENKP